jgi:hypothetical protein
MEQTFSVGEVARGFNVGREYLWNTVNRNNIPLAGRRNGGAFTLALGEVGHILELVAGNRTYPRGVLLEAVTINRKNAQSARDRLAKLLEGEDPDDLERQAVAIEDHIRVERCQVGRLRLRALDAKINGRKLEKAHAECVRLALFQGLLGGPPPEAPAEAGALEGGASET